MPFDPVLYYAQQIDGAVPGLTLRDLFAAAALPTITTKYLVDNQCGVGTDHLYSNVPHHAYRMADAMLAAREKRDAE